MMLSIRLLEAVPQVMSAISREHLFAYLDDALSDSEIAQVEQQLRSDPQLRRQLQQAIQDRDRGEHTLGAIWRRERLTCPSRETLGSYLLKVLDDAEQDYIEFHLQTVQCPYCVANLADLKSQAAETPRVISERRRRIFQSSAGLLRPD